MDRLSPLDASFLEIEDDTSHMHIASVAIFEGPPPRHDEARAWIESKLPKVPRYRQRIHFAPLNLARPVWEDDPCFNLDYHLRHTALPEPGDSEQLRRLVGRVMSQQLDRGKPLWEMWIVEGLRPTADGPGRWAVASKIHHAMVDGVSGTDLLTVLLDDTPEPAPPEPDPWSPRPRASGVQMVAATVVDQIQRPIDIAKATRRAVADPRRTVSEAATTARGTLAMRSLLRIKGGSSLNGPIGPHRRWTWARVTLDDVKTVRNAFGGTVNDVVLTIIAGGFRCLLIARGESPDRPLRSLVPVSVRKPDERGTYNNRVSAMYANLPVGVKDSVARLADVRAQMDELKQSGQAVAGETLTSLAGFAPPLLLSLGMRAAARMPQRSLHTVTTNVPGPRKQLYALGRPLVEAYPFVPLAGDVRVGVAIFSYQGALTFGITGDYETAPDIDVLARGIEDELATLVAAAQARDGDGPAAQARPRARSRRREKVR